MEATPTKSWTLAQLGEYVLAHGKKSAHDAWLVGRALIVAKEHHPKAYVAWLKSLKMATATAYRYMEVARKFDEGAIQGMTLWEAYAVLDEGKAGKGKGKKSKGKKTPRYYTNHVASVSKLVESRGFEKWGDKDRATFLAAVAKLVAMATAAGIVPATQPAPVAEPGLPPVSHPFLNPAVIHAALMPAPVEGERVPVGVLR
jgi:hypothetical protein